MDFSRLLNILVIDNMYVNYQQGILFPRKVKLPMSNVPQENSQSQQRYPISNASPAARMPISAPMPPVASGPGSRLMNILHPGELLEIIGGIVTLTAFYNLPFLVSSSFATTGKELASKSWHLTTQGWQLPANESGMRWLLWLMVLFVLMMIIVSALRLLGIVSRGERTSRLLLISGGAAVLFLLVGFFTQYAGSLVSGFWLGSGFLLALVSTIVLAVGGYLEVRPYLQM